MSDLSIFLIGLFTFLMLAGGLTFTVREIRRIEADERR